MKRGMNCFLADQCSDRLMGCGIAGALLGYAMRALGVPGAEYAALAGYALLLGGWALGVRYVVCPHCGTSLSKFLRLPGDLPGRCPHCGERIEPPEE